jgi:8-oxo-dGTP pyrophosphatase MutT (NUDIX family)
MAPDNSINDLTTVMTKMSLHKQTTSASTKKPLSSEVISASATYKALSTSNTIKQASIDAPKPQGDSIMISPSLDSNTATDASIASADAASNPRPPTPLSKKRGEQHGMNDMKALPADTATSNSTFTFDASLVHHHISAAEYLDADPRTQVLATGTAIFARSSSGQDHLLLVQRSPTDSYPNCWEIPGGSVDMTGETILEAAARELMEETRLHVTKFVNELDPTRFSTGRGNRMKWWNKFTFMAEVAEVEAKASQEEVKSDTERIGAKVLLDEKEHQAWLWATEEDIRRCQSGTVSLKFVNNRQQKLMLDGFAKRKGASSSSSSSWSLSTPEHAGPGPVGMEPENP